jgi:flavin-dependent dehydrogenase
VAGASTARLLAQAGLRVLVVERARRGADTLSTHALMRGGVLQLQRWNLLDRVLASGAPPVARVTFHYGAQVVPVALKPQAGVAALYAPRRTVLDSILVEAAETAGATFRFGVAVTDVVRNTDGRVVGVSLRNDDGTRWTQWCGIVVGADGRGSAVADRIAAPVIVEGRHRGSYAYGYWPAAADGYQWCYGNGISGGIIPTNDGLACLFVGGSTEAFPRAESTQQAHRRLAEQLGGPIADLVTKPPAGRVRRFPGLASRLRRPYGPGWVLVGDAGVWLDPLSTHGITEALREAELLADAILGGQDSEADVTTAMLTFQFERDRIARPMLRVSDQLASHRWNSGTVRPLLGVLSELMAEEVQTLRDPATAAQLPARSA